MLFPSSNNLSVQKECPIIINLQPTSDSIIKGCPGIPRSIPRIDTIIQIRSKTGLPFKLRSVSAQLITSQYVNLNKKLGTSSETYKDFKIFEDPLIFRSLEFVEDVLGVDIPVLIPIPKDIISSGHSPNFNCTTLHHLFIRVFIGDSASSEISFMEKFPVVIKLYDALPLYRQFSEVVSEARETIDKQVLIHINMSVGSIGPGDSLPIQLRIMTNSGNNKLKKHLNVKTVTFQVKEILECFDGGLTPRKEEKIYSTTKTLNKELNTEGIVESFNYTYPNETNLLSFFNHDKLPMNLPSENLPDYETTVIESINISNVKSFSKMPQGLGITHNHSSFTSQGKLYSIKFEIVLKFKFSKVKDLDIHLPIIVCPYNRTSSEYLLSWILEQCNISKDKFGKYFIENYYSSTYTNQIQLLNRYKKSPYVYKFIRNEWIELGYNGDAFGKFKNIVSYID
ncbi:unnamed protein product [Candida verbasci]|uniref:Arrestin C-terminal-like domain-containing protein n=1 Tax=Candida verbasci TaxID=1227364 RepID=A0A9W4TW28_9ASCO|nr:unnamed protein product [Candida verbasci]